MLKIGILGRTQILYNAAVHLHQKGYAISFIATSKASPDYTKNEDDFENLAKKWGIPFFYASSFKDDPIVQCIENVDIVLSMNWISLIPKNILDIPKHGFLNFHMGDLPRYRGNACPNWAILNGEKKVGLTIHKMDEGLDTGDIVLKEFFEMDDHTYIQDIYDYVENFFPIMAEKVINTIKDDTLPSDPQDQTIKPLRCYPRKPVDGLIHWKESVQNICRLVRASSRPFEGSFTFLEDGRKVIIWSSEEEYHEGDFFAIPGQVLYHKNGDPVIACGNGCVRLIDIDVEGCIDKKEAKIIILKSLRQRLIS